MIRTPSHIIETNSKDFIRMKINSFYPNGDALVREWSERDYGIDLVVEFFNNGIPTGNIAYVQIKATENEIKRNCNSNDVSCQGVSLCSLEYAKQSKIPFILIYISMHEPKIFYFIDIQSLDVKSLYEKANANETKRTTVRIPITNVSSGDMGGLFDIINKYY